MRLDQSFAVGAPIDQVYEALLDLERVAPCVPGAQVLERNDDGSYVVGIKIKVGPISMQYRSNVEIVEQDPVAHRAVMKVTAKETRGGGTADATAELQLSQEDAQTLGDVGVDVALTGKAASMGQGAIRDVSNRLVGQFAGNLQTMLAAAAPAAAAPAATAPAVAGEEGAAPVAPAPPVTPPPAPPVADAISGGDILKAVAVGRLSSPPFALGLAGFTLVVGFLVGWLVT